jgi:hypothetical protein
MLLNLILQDACENGMMEYDFLGVNDDWKFDWTRETRSHQWLFLFRNTVRGGLLHRTKFHIVPKVRNLVSSVAALYGRSRSGISQDCQRSQNSVTGPDE